MRAKNDQDSTCLEPILSDSAAYLLEQGDVQVDCRPRLGDFAETVPSICDIVVWSSKRTCVGVGVLSRTSK